MASQAGLSMPPTALFPAKKGPGYFGVGRFDRIGNCRLHLQTISGLLNVDHTLPSLGYGGLLKATRSLTRRQADVDQVFNRMVFNVMARNRDGHTKNHSFLMTPDGEWAVSPAYDLTLSSGPGGEHALDIAGEGRDPGVEHILAAAVDVGISKKFARATIEQVKAAVDRWPGFANASGVSKRMISSIDGILNGSRGRNPRPKPGVVAT